jgi:hypothetical protein
MMSLRMALRSMTCAAFALVVLACGPDVGDDTGAATSGSDDGSAGSASTGGIESSVGSSGATTTGSGSASASGASTGTDTSGTADGGSAGETGGCPPSLVPVEPGCEPAPDGVPIPAAGCYAPCEQIGAPCDAGGVCRTVWVNPCVCPDGEGCCAACGGESMLCVPGGATGDECMADADCASGVCWNFSDYDPCCFGTACSDACETDGDCQALAADAGATAPENARCGADGLCDLVGTGLGSWACAGPPCG